MDGEKLRVYRQLSIDNEWSDKQDSRLTKDEKYWLQGNESLTKQLIAASTKFEVNVIAEIEGACLESEASKLAIDKNTLVRIREVELVCDNKAAVYARSIIPLEALNGTGKELETLGNKPLGHLLFKQATVDISTRDIAKSSVDKVTKWARRTIYNFNEQDILVSEYFLFDINDLTTLTYKKTKD